jgi:hypothetical protein
VRVTIAARDELRLGDVWALRGGEVDVPAPLEAGDGFDGVV